MTEADEARHPSFLSRTGTERVLTFVGFFLFPLLLYAAGALVPYRRYMEHRDLHVWVQSCWNTLHGDWFQITITGCNQLGVHFSWILAAFVPVYALFRTPAALLLLQALSLAAAVWIGYRLARRVAGEGALPALFTATALLFHPAMLGSAVWGFYAANFATAFLLAAFWAVEAGRERRAWLLFLLALGCKVDVALVVILFGLYRGLVRREKGRGLGLAAFGLLYFALAFGWIMPALRDGASIADWTGRYAHLGTGPAEMVRNLASRSADLLLGGGKIGYLARLLAPTWFAALLTPLALAALPAVGINLLSSFRPQTLLLGPYDAGIVAVLFYAGLLGLARLRTRWPDRRCKGFAAAALAVSLLFLFTSLPFGRLVGLNREFTNPPLSQERIRAAHRIESLIPTDASLAADLHLAPRVAARRVIEAPVRDLRELAAGRYDFVWVDLELLDREQRERLRRAVAEHYRTAVREAGFLLLERRTPVQ